MTNSEFPIKIFTGGYEIIASGIVHTETDEIQFELAGLIIKYRFKSDGGTGRFAGTIVDNALVIDLFNANNVLSEGKVDPVEIGNLGGRALFATWVTNTLETNRRQFSYTFMLRKQ